MWLLPDLAHDVFEGFAFDFMSGIIGVLVEQKCFTLQELNNRISTFEYAHIDQTKKQQPLKIISSVSFKLKETACEMWSGFDQAFSSYNWGLSRRRQSTLGMLHQVCFISRRY